ncbi:MAG: hypothetical protein HYT79_06235 [Elusimicrobia bacterium]|nr:hypothetical protein [Elusimicrobiota bacterium]
MRYRIYNQGQVVGPMELDIIQAQPWFNGNLLLCPESSPGITASDWKRADEILKSEMERPGDAPAAQAKGLGASPMARRIEAIEKNLDGLTQAQKQWELRIEEEIGSIKAATEGALEEIRQKISEQAVETGRLTTAVNQSAGNVESLGQRLASLDQWANHLKELQQSLLGLEANVASLKERLSEIGQKQQDMETAAEESEKKLEGALLRPASVARAMPAQQPVIASTAGEASPAAAPAQETPKPPPPPALHPVAPARRIEPEVNKPPAIARASPSLSPQSLRLSIIAAVSLIVIGLALWIYFGKIRPVKSSALSPADLQGTSSVAPGLATQPGSPMADHSGFPVNVFEEPPKPDMEPAQPAVGTSSKKRPAARKKTAAKSKKSQPTVTVEMPGAPVKPAKAKSTPPKTKGASKLPPGLALPGFQNAPPATTSASNESGTKTGTNQDEEYFPDAP